MQVCYLVTFWNFLSVNTSTGRTVNFRRNSLSENNIYKRFMSYSVLNTWTNKIVDHTLLALCPPITPSRPIPFAPNTSTTEWSLLLHDVAWHYWWSNDPFCSEHATMHCQWGRLKKTLKTAPSTWDFVTLPEKDRATAIGSIHRKIGKDRTCGSKDILANNQTHGQTDGCTHHNTLPQVN